MSSFSKRPHRLRLLLAWTALCATLTALSLNPAVPIEAQRSAAVRSRYAGWSGVLRLWTCEGWQSGAGSLSLWLTDRVSAFERSHDGVYIQLTEVPSDTLRAFAQADNPPDMLLFYPGLLDTPNNLWAIDADVALRKGLSAVGFSENSRYALPVAMGAYGIVYNQQILKSLPADWSALSPDQPATLPKQRAMHWLSCPADSPAQCWSAALIALFSGTTQEQLAREESPAGEGLDLGLPEPSPVPSETEEPAVQRIENALPSKLPDHFRQSASIYSDFTGLTIAAMPATQRDIRRLQLLSESGKAPDWAVGVSGAAFTDQLALLAVTDCPHTALEARQALCADFASFLVSPDSQSALAKVRALPVTETAPLYAAQAGLSTLEGALAGQSILAAPAFGSGWRAEAARLAQQMTDGALTPAQAMEALQILLAS